MKKFFFLSIMVLIICLASCNSKSSFEADVKKMAGYRCKEMQLMRKDQTDEKVKKQLENLRVEIDAYRQKMSEKYKGKETDKEMNEKADKIMQEEMAKCK
ncbi:MAG: hypothetical protein HZB42_15190 [Sphingobacteriales bacterium]|nr:hypothetical protein [Sphingobacteriales bacterium]